MEDLLLGTILVQLLIGIFKQELSDFITDLMLYKNRHIDIYGDPGIGNDCYIQVNEDYKRITILDYHFGLLSVDRKVTTLHHINENEVIIVPYSYVQWNNLIKGSVPINRAVIVFKEKNNC